MKLQLNFGDWATIAFMALATVLGFYARSERELSPSTARRSYHADDGRPRTGLERCITSLSGCD